MHANPFCRPVSERALSAGMPAIAAQPLIAGQAAGQRPRRKSQPHSQRTHVARGLRIAPRIVVVVVQVVCVHFLFHLLFHFDLHSFGTLYSFGIWYSCIHGDVYIPSCHKISRTWSFTSVLELGSTGRCHWRLAQGVRELQVCAVSFAQVSQSHQSNLITPPQDAVASTRTKVEIV